MSHPKPIDGLENLTPPGVEVYTWCAGIKQKTNADLCVLTFPENTVVAGVFTQSKTPGAPVDRSRRNLSCDTTASALIVNSGNANAFTGKQGEDDCLAMCTVLAKKIGAQPEQVYVASTGVIGERLPIDRILSSVHKMISHEGKSSWEAGAKAIMTTDLVSKIAYQESNIGGSLVRIWGMAKGSGMIAPNMATMLGFIVTDAKISSICWQKMLQEAVKKTFNAITVDGDTSTSDMCLGFATQKAKNDFVDDFYDPNLHFFRESLFRLAKDLSLQIVSDGEGAKKIIEVFVCGAESEAAAMIIAKSVANSMLVKTMIAGEDANWGRIVMAVGKAGEKVNQNRLAIKIGGIAITESGQVKKGFDEKSLTEHMRGKLIVFEIDIGVGCSEARSWGCDLTHEYISINADYRS